MFHSLLQKRLISGLLACATLASTITLVSPASSEVVTFDGRTTYYREGLPYGKMSVINPSVSIAAQPTEGFGLNAGYQADVVSGASIKIRNAVRGQDPDAISSASVKDFRSLAFGGVELKRKDSTVAVGYSYSTENDYKSHSIDVSAKAEFLQKTVELALAYSRNWDSVCDRLQPDPDPTRRRSLDKSDGCFKVTPGLTTHDIAVDGLQGSYTQLWSPTFTTQLIFSTQLSRGFLSNPYREVNIGVNASVQEHVPEVRVRLAAGLRANWYVRPLKLAVRVAGRLYRDTWDLRAVTAELELERYLFGESLRVRLRGRYYAQTSAIFYSDDYLNDPRGAYWTGDRELSSMQSILAGARLAYGGRATRGRWLGMLEGAEISLSTDLVFFRYGDFTINGEPLKKTALIGSLGFSLLF